VASDPDFLTMRTDDFTGNRKSHACAFEVLPSTTTIELIEDPGLFILADAWPLIGHVNDHTSLASIAPIKMGLPGREYFTALSIKCAIISTISSASTNTKGRSSATCNLRSLPSVRDFVCRRAAESKELGK